MERFKGFLCFVVLSGAGLTSVQSAFAGTFVTCERLPGGTVVVDGTEYPQADIIDCSIVDDGIGGGEYGDPYGGGGSGTSPNVFPKATDHPNQTYPATCRSDVGIRHLHASNDVAFTQARRLSTGAGSLQSGALIEVAYDDGGTERWMVISPLSTSPLSPVPVQGTLQCP